MRTDRTNQKNIESDITMSETNVMTGRDIEHQIDLRARQRPLKERYLVAPDEAQVGAWASTKGDMQTDAVHGEIDFGWATGGADPSECYTYGKPDDEDYDITMATGVHRAVGGEHDLPNPGNILSAALASCLYSTIRVLANRMQIQLESLEVKVAAHADVRGTLLVDKNVPVGFQRMKVIINLVPPEGTDPKQVKELINAAEYCSINLQTLQSGVHVDKEYHLGVNEL